MKKVSAGQAQRVLELARALQQIPSPTFHEDHKAAFVHRHFQGNGLSALDIDGAGNVLACLPGERADSPLVFSAHLDTVFPENFPLSLALNPASASGPGIGDNSLGLAALIFLPELIRSLKIRLRHSIWLAATTGEEGLGDLKGIRAVVDRFGSGPNAYISLEGMGLGDVLHRGLGVERYRITAAGPGGHSWVDYGAPSAIHELLRMGARMSALALPANPRTTFNIGVIQGGTSINAIASGAWMEIDLRSESPLALADLSARIRGLVEEPHPDGVHFQMDQIGLRPAGEIPPGHPLVVAALKTLKELGIQAHLDIASTEANYPLSRGFPALTIGLTSGSHAHSAQETIDVPPIRRGLQQIAGLIENIWKGE